MALDLAELAHRHNPILVLYPQEPERRRPGARRPRDVGWGDYHPCSAEFFLARVHQRDQPKSYDISGLCRRSWEPLPRTGLEPLREKVARTPPNVSAGWELDLADIPSQSEHRAWQQYGMLLQEPDNPYERVVYARCHLGPSGTAIQYWYLYTYNDFHNNHEADWEMVAIEVDTDGSPREVGISCHHGGWRRPWNAAPRDGDRPVVHVARGSHGGYFRYRRQGHLVVDLKRQLNLPTALRWLQPFLQRLPVLRWRDHPPADPELDTGAPDRHRGVRAEPELKIMPEGDPSPDSDWWWMRYYGKWGSTHTRIMGTIGVDSPWAQRGGDIRWSDPVGWIRSLRNDQG